MYTTVLTITTSGPPRPCQLESFSDSSPSGVSRPWILDHSRCSPTRLSSASILLNSPRPDRKSTRLNSSHLVISYAVFCLKKKKTQNTLHAMNHKAYSYDRFDATA